MTVCTRCGGLPYVTPDDRWLHAATSHVRVSFVCAHDHCFFFSGLDHDIVQHSERLTLSSSSS